MLLLSKASPEHGLTSVARMHERSLPLLAPLTSTLLSPFLPSAVWATLFLLLPSACRLWPSSTFWSAPIAILCCRDTKQVSESIAAVSEKRPLQNVVLPTRAQHGRARASNESSVVRHFDRETEIDEIAVIIRSSGSTELPKSVSLSHRNMLTHPMQGAAMNSFGALPLFHMYGLSTTFQAMHMRKRVNPFSASLPMTGEEPDDCH